MPRFWNYINQTEPETGSLPLIHSTDIFGFREIKDSGMLVPNSDENYPGQSLLYFFYGRPSYRPHGKRFTVTAKSFLPVCLVFKRTPFEKALRIVPFDSGAFYLKAMHPPMHDDMHPRDFEMAINANAPSQIIKLFYGSEKNYFNSKPRERPDRSWNEYEDLEVDAYFRLLWHRGNESVDDRISAIEIQTKEKVVLQSSVSAVIMPKPYLDSPGIIQQVESWGAVAIPYNVKEEFIPREIQGAIFDRLAEFLECENILY